MEDNFVLCCFLNHNNILKSCTSQMIVILKTLCKMG
uniref:Macaca fascicularis brain cDNA clone: QflA-16274, similar to human KIAA1671 protein (KIAA1671), mRNA, RefSeq: XM_371461.2 n=1 Tax=Macaca fascicularis TaxID=9541 RepID=I7GKY4_MACFA|nr:unnamed protein product [Macaca fascicularis]